MKTERLSAQVPTVRLLHGFRHTGMGILEMWNIREKILRKEREKRRIKKKKKKKRMKRNF